MLETKNLLKATMDAGRELVRSPVGRAHVDPADKPLPLIVPIHSLGENHRQRINAHLLALDRQDRYLRFGYAATDEQIARYVASLDFERDEIFGIYNRKLVLVAMAHNLYHMVLVGEGRN